MFYEKNLSWYRKKKLGINDLPENIVMVPYNIKRYLGEMWMRKIRGEGAKIKVIRKDHRYFGKIGNNYLLDNTLIVCCGRGISNAIDISYLVCSHENVKRIFFISSAAGIYGIKSKDINIPKEAYYFDNLNNFTEKIKIEISKEILKFTKNFFKNSEIDVANGKNATVLSLHLESEKFLKEAYNLRINTVDMEFFGVVKIAKRFSKEVVGFLIAEEIPLKKIRPWNKEMKREYLREKVQSFLKTFLIMIGNEEL